MIIIPTLSAPLFVCRTRWQVELGPAVRPMASVLGMFHSRFSIKFARNTARLLYLRRRPPHLPGPTLRGASGTTSICRRVDAAIPVKDLTAADNQSAPDNLGRVGTGKIAISSFTCAGGSRSTIAHKSQRP